MLPLYLIISDLFFSTTKHKEKEKEKKAQTAWLFGKKKMSLKAIFPPLCLLVKVKQ